MKLFSSFQKELKLASRGFYFYIELFMAFLILLVFLFVIPNNFENKQTEYLYLDMPLEISEMYLQRLEDESVDGKAQAVTLLVDKVEKDAILYSLKDKDIYILSNLEDGVTLADKKRELVAHIKSDSDYNLTYEYYLQGYESEKYKNLLKILYLESSDTLESTVNNQDVRPLSSNLKTLSDRENMIPSVLVFNGSLMGLFIIAAYIFLDKQEGVIKAYALTPSAVWYYLMSKIAVVMSTAIVSSFIVIVPIMGFQPNYILLLVLLISTGFFSSSLGLLLASFYDNIMQAFGLIYGIMMLMILPSIAYSMPTWSPAFVKLIPSYYMLEGFKSILLANGDWFYVLFISSEFFLVGLILFAISNNRYKKTLIA